MRRYVHCFAITKIHFLAGREVVSLVSGTGGSAEELSHAIVVGSTIRRRKRGCEERREKVRVITKSGVSGEKSRYNYER